MPLSLLPNLILQELPQLSPQLLQTLQIDLLMLDFDNTIVPYTTNVPSQRMERWLRAAVNGSVPVCVVSNSKKPRVTAFCKTYGLDCITHAKKPFSRGIRTCLTRYGVAPERAALVGDQIYTDVLGANAAGVRSILVRAIHNHNFWLKLRHVAELPVLLFAIRRRYHEG